MDGVNAKFEITGGINGVLTVEVPAFMLRAVSIVDHEGLPLLEKVFESLDAHVNKLKAVIAVEAFHATKEVAWTA